MVDQLYKIGQEVKLLFKKVWRNLPYLVKGGVMGGVGIGILKIPFFILFGDMLPAKLVYFLGKMPDELLCNLFNLGIGEKCGFFVLFYGFIYNPIFYGLIGIIVGLLCQKLRK